MNSIISFPGKIASIGGEIDYHGNAITTEVRVMHGIIDDHGKGIEKEMKMMHGIIDDHGKGIEKEMKMMRESFEKEMQSLHTKTRRLCITVVAVNILSRVFLK
jgi:hypothetical protein